MSSARGPADTPSPPNKQGSLEPSETPRRVTKTFRNLHQQSRTAPTKPSSPTKQRWFTRRPRITPPSQVELDALPVKERQELLNARQQHFLQVTTSSAVIIGSLLAFGGLFYTGRTWETSQKTLNATLEAQLTDRYTKAVEQIGSKTIDVRLGGIYALERLARDSIRDHQTIYDVIAAFVLEHDSAKKKAPWRPSTDVQAALVVIGRRATERDTNPLNLFGMRTPRAELIGANLSNANLMFADLTFARLRYAKMTSAFLWEANLTTTILEKANLDYANLFRAKLDAANLRNASLRGATLVSADMRNAALNNAIAVGINAEDSRWEQANLEGANLSSANLLNANLDGANLKKVNLIDANLKGAQLFETDLRGANLCNSSGLTEDQIESAITDATTKFSTNCSRSR